MNIPLESYSSFVPLLGPLDNMSLAQIDNGDYLPSQNSAVLPYLSHDGKTVFGSFSGVVSGNEFKGTWFSNDFGTVGSFDLIKQE